jgi:predicted ATP-grasp superfamily ATP-dependent carboligase
MGAIRCLGVTGIPVVNLYYADSDFSQASRYVRARIRSPHPERHEREFVDLLIHCAARFGKCMLLPANDATLGVVSRRKRELEAYHYVACADWSTTEKLLDKKHTYALADALGVPAPRTETPGSEQDVECIGRSFMFPCLVKPRESHRYVAAFGAKVAKVWNLEQLRAEFGKALAAGVGVMVQEYVPGDDSHGFNYNSYSSQGRVVDFTAQKVRLAPREFGLPRVVICRDVPEVVAPARRILEAIGYAGYSCTEFKLDPRDGIYKLMEVNARVNRSILHPLACGINFPLMAYRDLVLGEAIGTRERPGQPVYWIDLASDIRYNIREWRTGQQGLAEAVRPYRSPKIFAVGGLTDPAPFLKRSLHTIASRARALGATPGRRDSPPEE